MTEATLDAGACPHCGTALQGRGACSRTCGARGSCVLMCCPGCGQALPDPRRSRLAHALAGWLARRQRARAQRSAEVARPLAEAGVAAATPLPALGVGGTGRIVALRCATAERLQQLTALGLVPGAPVRLRQRRPAVVLEVGETTLALDAELAAEIAVQPAS